MRAAPRRSGADPDAGSDRERDRACYLACRSLLVGANLRPRTLTRNAQYWYAPQGHPVMESDRQLCTCMLDSTSDKVVAQPFALAGALTARPWRVLSPYDEPAKRTADDGSQPLAR